MSTSDALEVRGLTKSYGSRTVVEDVSFRVPRGRIVGLLGPNGAGKSTTLRCLVGLSRPSAGTTLIDGQPFSALTEPARHIGVHMDGFGFETGITAHRHLEIVRLAVGAPRVRTAEVLHEVGLAADANRRVRTFSTGMVQRLGLATALIARPRTLILDEPANGLDPEGIRWLRAVLRSFADEGGSVLVSSHQLPELQHIVDDVVVLQRRLLFSGPLDSLVRGSGSLEESYFDVLSTSTGEHS